MAQGASVRMINFADLTLRDLAVNIVDETDFHACARLAARCGNTWIRLGH